MVVDAEDVFVLQQCLRYSRERNHVVTADKWSVSADTIVPWEYTPVSDQLNAEIGKYQWFSIRGTPLSALVAPFMTALTHASMLEIKGRTNGDRAAYLH